MFPDNLIYFYYKDSLRSTFQNFTGSIQGTIKEIADSQSIPSDTKSSNELNVRFVNPTIISVKHD